MGYPLRSSGCLLGVGRAGAGVSEHQRGRPNGFNGGSRLLSYIYSCFPANKVFGWTVSNVQAEVEPGTRQTEAWTSPDSSGDSCGRTTRMRSELDLQGNATVNDHVLQHHPGGGHRDNRRDYMWT